MLCWYSFRGVVTTSCTAGRAAATTIQQVGLGGGRKSFIVAASRSTAAVKPSFSPVAVVGHKTSFFRKRSMSTTRTSVLSSTTSSAIPFRIPAKDSVRLLSSSTRRYDHLARSITPTLLIKNCIRDSIIFCRSALNVRGGAASNGSTRGQEAVQRRGSFDNMNSSFIQRTMVSSTSSKEAIDDNNDNVGNDTTINTTTSFVKYKYRVFLAVGSNLGDRYMNIDNALQLLCDGDDDPQCTTTKACCRIVRTSFLHETAPMYVLDQPNFMNGVVEIVTNDEPHTLLSRLKCIEQEIGRDLEHGIRNGPRPIDLDILLYYYHNNNTGDLDPVLLNDHNLTIPHPRIQERDFVLKPLLEILQTNNQQDTLLHPVLNTTMTDLFQMLQNNRQRDIDNGVGDVPNPMVRILPLPRGRVLSMNETIVMGILNVTPDSFSDGGDNYNASNDNVTEVVVQSAVQRALEMIREGAHIIDIGGESTRPGAEEVAVQEELQRTIPVIEGIRNVSDIPISIDTRHSKVAQAAIHAGADIVNDVSGGMHDYPNMFQTVARFGNVPMIIMHMRGTPQTMMKLTEYGTKNDADDVVTSVTNSLLRRSSMAEEAGIQRWRQVIDPGIGFAKDLNGNLALLKNLQSLRSVTGNLPILLGTSRKGFIGKLSNVDVPKHRDPGTIASCVAALCLDTTPGDNCCNIIRVHNVADNKQAALIMDAIRNSR